MNFHRIRIRSAENEGDKLLGVWGGAMTVELDGHPVQVDRLELTVDREEYNCVTMTLRGVEVDADLETLLKAANGRSSNNSGNGRDPGSPS